MGLRPRWQRPRRPAAALGAHDYLQREEIAGWTRPPHLASYSTDYATLSVADTAAGIGVQWLRDASAMAPWEGGAPLRSILRWTLERHGVHLIHAAAVGNGADGVLLLGSGGAGKSTTALACMQAGMALVADDYTLVAPGAPPTAHPAFAIAKAAPASLELLGGGGSRRARGRRPRRLARQAAAADRRRRLPVAGAAGDRPAPGGAAHGHSGPVQRPRGAAHDRGLDAAAACRATAPRR